MKVAGYAAFASVLNRYARKPVAPLKFGIVKTAIGLTAGLAYLFLFLYLTDDDIPSTGMFIGAWRLSTASCRAW